MSVKALDKLEAAVERLLAALAAERARSRDLAIRVAELEAEMCREPDSVEKLREENRRLRRNAELAAEKLTELVNRL